MRKIIATAGAAFLGAAFLGAVYLAAAGSTFKEVGTKKLECPVYVSAVDAGIAGQITTCAALYDCWAEDAGCSEDGGCTDAYAACEDAGDCSLDAKNYDAYSRAETPAAAITGSSGYRGVTVLNNTAAHVYLHGVSTATSVDGGYGPLCRGTGCVLGATAVDVYQGHLWCLAASASTDGGTGAPISVMWGN